MTISKNYVVALPSSMQFLMIIDSSEVSFPPLCARRASLIMKFTNTEINCNSATRVRVASLRPDYRLHECSVAYYTGIFIRLH